MGTTTFYLRHNDLKKSVSSMSKAEREKFDKLSPYDKEQRLGGWHVPCELHNGNVYPLVFWKGRLMKLEDTPMLLNKKYYDTYRGKTRNKYEWTILKRFLTYELARLDKEFKNSTRRKK